MACLCASLQARPAPLPSRSRSSSCLSNPPKPAGQQLSSMPTTVHPSRSTQHGFETLYCHRGCRSHNQLPAQGACPRSAVSCGARVARLVARLCRNGAAVYLQRGGQQPEQIIHITQVTHSISAETKVRCRPHALASLQARIARRPGPPPRARTASLVSERQPTTATTP